MNVARKLLEIACLSDLVILKICPYSFMDAGFPSIETCVKIIKQSSNYEIGINYCNLAMNIIDEKSKTLEYCLKAKEKFSKQLKKR